MFAVLSVTTAPTDTVPLSLIVVLLIAVAAIVTIGVVVRRLRIQGKLSFANASTSAAAAAFILATALLASVSIGSPTRAVAEPSHPVISHEADDGYQPIPIEGLEGYQLPTK